MKPALFSTHPLMFPRSDIFYHWDGSNHRDIRFQQTMCIFWYNLPNGATSIPVYALTSGKVDKILLVPVLGIQECKVWFRVNEKFSYYFDHIVLDPSIKEGSSITAGQTIGTTGLSSSIDLGAIDETITLTGYANPKRYGWEETYCGKPFQYFTNALKTQLYPLVDREGTDKDGRIDIDIPGRLTGNWFLDGTVFYMNNPDGWDKELSFAFDIQHPSVVLVSIGGTINMLGKWTIAPGTPLPSQVSVANGKSSVSVIQCRWYFGRSQSKRINDRTNDRRYAY